MIFEKKKTTTFMKIKKEEEDSFEKKNIRIEII